MAHDNGAKRLQEENNRRLKHLLRFILACNVSYLVVRAGIFHSSFKSKQWFNFLLTFFTYFIPYLHISLMAKPTYAEDGELLDSVDLTTNGYSQFDDRV
ncbi:Transmembrane protein [Actinidia chinensis var. chinensis]|uniref:Transmembrane protein n=1 Tax=Actinidia chinensis var. chinensis TaxID=1590841 RepID=A0A2R6QHX9_ACTCC|nr:Transmembrane protein [Actinidia chinensis var. chinensis]